MYPIIVHFIYILFILFVEYIILNGIRNKSFHVFILYNLFDHWLFRKCAIWWYVSLYGYEMSYIRMWDLGYIAQPCSSSPHTDLMFSSAPIFFFFFKSLQCSTFSGHLSHMLHVHHDLFAKPVYIMLCRIFNSAKSKNLLFFYFKLLFQSVAFPLRRKLKMHIEMHFIVTIWKTADLALLTLPQWF